MGLSSRSKTDLSRGRLQKNSPDLLLDILSAVEPRHNSDKLRQTQTNKQKNKNLSVPKTIFKTKIWCSFYSYFSQNMLMLSDSGGAESNNLHCIFIRLRALCYSSEYDHPVITATKQLHKTLLNQKCCTFFQDGPHITLKWPMFDMILLFTR